MLKLNNEKNRNIPFSIIVSKAQQQHQLQSTLGFQNQNNTKNKPFSTNTNTSLMVENSKLPIYSCNNPFNSPEADNNDLILLNRKRASNGPIDGNGNSNHPNNNIFGVQNTFNYYNPNPEKEREEKQMKIKAKKDERRNKELNAIETKKTNTKESLDMALGIALHTKGKIGNGNKHNLNLNENDDAAYNKKNSNEDIDLSDLSSEE